MPDPHDLAPATISGSAHNARVDAVCEQVRAAATAGGPVHIHKGGVHHFVPLPGDGRFAGGAVDISMLTNVLEIDAEQRLCVAERGATLADVVRNAAPRAAAEGRA